MLELKDFLYNVYIKQFRIKIIC